MEKQQTELKPVEIRRAEDRMTPLQIAMSQARSEIESHLPDFVAAELSKEQVEAVADEAVKRAKLEFEKQEGEDPLLRIGQALENAAETPEETKFAQAGSEALTAFRLAWKELARRTKLRAENENAGRLFDLREMVGKARWSNVNLALVVDARTYGPGYAEIEDFPMVLIVPRVFREGESPQKSSPVFMERVLQELGAQNMDDLKLLPPSREPGDRGARYNYSDRKAERVPTNIPGVDLLVDFGSAEIYAALDLKALEKAIDFPGNV